MRQDQSRITGNTDIILEKGKNQAVHKNFPIYPGLYLQQASLAQVSYYFYVLI